MWEISRLEISRLDKSGLYFSTRRRFWPKVPNLAISLSFDIPPTTATLKTEKHLPCTSTCLNTWTDCDTHGAMWLYIYWTSISWHKLDFDLHWHLPPFIFVFVTTLQTWDHRYEMPTLWRMNAKFNRVLPKYCDITAENAKFVKFIILCLDQINLRTRHVQTADTAESRLQLMTNWIYIKFERHVFA